MAELIDKGALYDAMTEEYKKHYAGTGKGYDFTIAMQMVQNQPTTTEADIRAKAIDEFKEMAFTMFTDFDMAHGYPTLGDVETILYDLAEQLKGGMRNGRENDKGNGLYQFGIPCNRA